MEIEISKLPVIERPIPAKENRPASVSRKQQAYLFLEGDEYPTKFLVRLNEGQAPYAPGRYKLGSGSLITDEWQGLKFSFDLNLVPVSPQSAKNVA